MAGKIKLFIFLFSSLLIFSCNDGNTLVNEYRKNPEKTWNWGKKNSFTFEITDLTVYYDLYFNLRIDGGYNYSNLYILASISGPEKTFEKQRFQWPLTADDGRWTGEGLGDIISYKLPLKMSAVFKTKGKYTIEFEQNMRDENLAGIMETGLEVKKGRKIF